MANQTDRGQPQRERQMSNFHTRGYEGQKTGRKDENPTSPAQTSAKALSTTYSQSVKIPDFAQ